ncbi:hypothetical protein CROQUDRAFT_271726 [Cronartium quercuum f. sp. fusiforme G11]|uniref:Uncharacterized protein n=1 Tax=Cronartium quercuum f. sp. fusiforme G11 TaxID=708437 RepID=A0A9P6T8Q4_9BASI|nr:hypothetical protein CROQUDRAFT_271726 [Cronartium quercuum f. sp. fusiforme G11]
MITLLQAVLAHLPSSPSVSETPPIHTPHIQLHSLTTSVQPPSLTRTNNLCCIPLISSGSTSFTPAYTNFTHLTLPSPANAVVPHQQYPVITPPSSTVSPRKVRVLFLPNACGLPRTAPPCDSWKLTKPGKYLLSDPYPKNINNPALPTNWPAGWQTRPNFLWLRWDENW